MSAVEKYVTQAVDLFETLKGFKVRSGADWYIASARGVEVQFTTDRYGQQVRVSLSGIGSVTPQEIATYMDNLSIVLGQVRMAVQMTGAKVLE